MILNLRAHPASILAAILKHSDPLRVLRVLNHVQTWSQCSIIVTKPGPRDTQLCFRFRHDRGLQPRVLPCLDGVVPQVFDCDKLICEEGDHSYCLTEPRAALDRTRNSLQLELATQPSRLSRKPTR